MPKSIIDIHYQLVDIFNSENDPIEPSGVKSIALLESACSRPLTSYGRNEKYKTLLEKAGALFHSLSKNHPFHNGNKRTALVSLICVLERNNYRFVKEVTDDNIYDFSLSVASDCFPEEGHNLSVDQVVKKITSWIRSHTERIDIRYSGMMAKDFIKKCELAGAKTKEVKGGSIAIMNKDKSIKISHSTRQLDGNAIARYLKKLNLSESSAGISYVDFKEGVSEEKAEIYRFISALRRLAKT